MIAFFCCVFYLHSSALLRFSGLSVNIVVRRRLLYNIFRGSALENGAICCDDTYEEVNGISKLYYFEITEVFSTVLMRDVVGRMGVKPAG